MGGACSRGADRNVVVVAHTRQPSIQKKDPYIVVEADNSGNGTDEKVVENKNDSGSAKSETAQDHKQDNGAPSSSSPSQHLANKRVALKDELRMESVNDLSGTSPEEHRPISPTSPTSTLKASTKNEDQLVAWVSKKLKNKLKLNRIAKAYERYSSLHTFFSYKYQVYPLNLLW